MVVTLLSSAVLSRSTSVPLVEVLDKEALSLAIFPELVPIISTWQAIVMGAKCVVFNPCGTFSQERGWSHEVCNSLQLQRAALKLLSIATEETAWGRKTSHSGVRVGILFWLKLSISGNIVATLTRGSKHVENTSSSAAVGSCTHRLSPGARDTLYKWEVSVRTGLLCALTRSALMPPPMRVNFSRRATFIPQ